MASTAIAAEVREWVLGGCRWRNNAFHSDPLLAITRGDRVLSHQYVFIDVLDCIFARGEYKHLRPVGRYKQSHSDASFSRNIYSPTSPERIPLQITMKYPSNSRGVELARSEWEREKICRGGTVLSSPDESVTCENKTHENDVDVNLMTRECAFSFVQIWLSQVIHDSDLHSERMALSMLHEVAKLSRDNQNNAAYIQSIRNVINNSPSATSPGSISATTSATAGGAANQDNILKNLFVLLITRDLMQDLRFHWGCSDLHRLRLPIRCASSERHPWEKVFFPVIVASAPRQDFCRGSLAGIVALAEVLAYHVIEPSHALATSLCSELVSRISTHSLGYETALRATRAALTRWAFEQSKDAATAETSSYTVKQSGDAYDHGLDEPKEIVLPILARLRAALMTEATPSRSMHITVTAPTSRKRHRIDDDTAGDDSDGNADEVGVFARPKKVNCSFTRGGGPPLFEADEDLFSRQALQTASRDALAVTTAAGPLSTEDKLGLLNECIAIIERVLQRRQNEASARKEESRPADGTGADTTDDDGYIDMVSDILLDLQCLDLTDGLRDRDVVAAAIEKTCARMVNMDLADHLPDKQPAVQG